MRGSTLLILGIGTLVISSSSPCGMRAVFGQEPLEDLSGLLGGGEEFPHPSGWVNDFADAFDPGEEAQMNALATEVLSKTGVELCIVTIRRVKMASTKSYASKLAEHWGLGQLSGNRCLLLLAMMEREEVALYVGYKLRSAFTDKVVAQLVRRETMPLFKQGRYGAAVYRGAYQAAKRVFSEKGLSLSLPPPAELPPDLRQRATQIVFRYRRPIAAGVLLWALWATLSRMMAAKRRREQKRREACFARRFQRGAGCFSPGGFRY